MNDEFLVLNSITARETLAPPFCTARSEHTRVARPHHQPKRGQGIARPPLSSRTSRLGRRPPAKLNCGHLRLFAPNCTYLRFFAGKKRLFIFYGTLRRNQFSQIKPNYAPLPPQGQILEAKVQPANLAQSVSSASKVSQAVSRLFPGKKDCLFFGLAGSLGIMARHVSTQINPPNSNTNRILADTGHKGITPSPSTLQRSTMPTPARGRFPSSPRQILPIKEMIGFRQEIFLP